MSNFFRTLLILAAAVLLCTNMTAASENEPSVFLIQADGKVMYSEDGKTWKNIYRNKFLYKGDRLKTGNDGTCKLINHQTGVAESVGSNAEIEILANGTKALKGLLSEAEQSTSLMGFLKRKFTKSQKFAAITRRTRSQKHVELKTVRNITLSEDYPDMVWENVGIEYSYQLIVGEKMFDVPASCDALVRFALTPISPGQSDYSVQVLYNGEILYEPGKKGKLNWLSDAEKNSFREKKQLVQEVDPDNGFLLGSFMYEQGLKVAAMDQYRKFLFENPDANEARPFLIQVLNDLKLKTLKEAEAVVYDYKLGDKK
ncbi:hypothetical protein QUF80_01625 [Desulfococcaceae bacterium HSG8]|nr:hypothetical protein [Desulfococcaceae bacterium HSG8]